MRIALVVLLVLAVVLPTVLLPRTAPGGENAYHSTRQVRRVFASVGLPLHLAARDQQTPTRASFSGPRGRSLSVIVFDRGVQRFFAIGWTGIRPTTSGEGNVTAIWTPSSPDETARIRRALSRLGGLPPR